MKVDQLLTETKNGALVVPDFQRSFVWEPEDVRELLVSVIGGYFIGSMLILEHFREDSPFALRLIEGVDKQTPIQSIVKILLDGQQRTTALFYALYEPKIPLKNRKSPYRFYVHIEKALSKDWNAAVIAVNLNDKRKLAEITKDNNIIPFSLLGDIGAVSKRFRDHPHFEAVLRLANDFMSKYEIHTVPLPRDTSLEMIVETFERINRTGEPLSTFELLTARLYKGGLKLRDILEASKAEYPALGQLSPDFILKTIALLRGKEPKRRHLLELEAKNFEQDWTRACRAFDFAYKRVTDTKDGYGSLDIKKWMPYTTMLVPLASMLDFVKDGAFDFSKNYEKIDRWYWASVFSNRYDQAADTTSAADFNNIKEWIANDSSMPEYIQKFDIATVDLNIDKQGAATYKGVINLVVLRGALDFKTGQPPHFDVTRIQDDHVFPKAIYKNDYIANRTVISTNAEKWKTPPSQYFKKKIDEHGIERLKEILKTHLIPEDALDCLLHDNLKGFIEKRKEAIFIELRRRTVSQAS